MNSVGEDAEESVINKLKTDLLSSTDARVVTMGIALNYYPKEHLILDKGGIEGSYTFKFYGAELNDSQYTKLVEYFHSIRQFPAINFGFQNILHNKYTPIEGMIMPNWSAPWGKYMHESGYNLVEKDGYVCLFPFADTKVSGVWQPEHDAFSAPAALIFRCTYLAEPKRNTPKKVAHFISNFLSIEGIKNINEDDIINNKLVDYLQEMRFSIPHYSVNLGYNEKYERFTDNLKIELRSELIKTDHYFKNASWKSTIEENTNSKLIRNWYSLKLIASNNLHECHVSIDLFGDGYVSYHPQEKNIRDQYPQYSDNEFEKYVLGGEVRRGINCFKSLIN